MVKLSRVAVEVPEVSVGRVAAPSDVAIEKVDRSFDTVRDLIIRGCRPITQAFKALQKESQPAFAEAEFGINFTAKGSVYVVESTGQAYPHNPHNPKNNHNVGWVSLQRNPTFLQKCL